MSDASAPEFEQGEVAWTDDVAEVCFATIATDRDEWAPLTPLENDILDVLLDAVTLHGGVPAAPSAETLAKHSGDRNGRLALALAERRHAAFRARLASDGAILHPNLDVTVAGLMLTILEEVLNIRAAVDPMYRRWRSAEFIRWGGFLMSQRAAIREASLANEHADRLRANSYIAPSIARHAISDTIVVRTITRLDELPHLIRKEHGGKENLVPGILYTHGDISGRAVWSQYATDDKKLRDAGWKYLASVHEQKPMLHPLMAARLAAGNLDTVLWVEGTKQHLAAVTLYRDKPSTLVMGGAGCWGWSADKVATLEFLTMVRAARAAGAARAVIMMDVDSRTNRGVWLASDRLHDVLVAEGFTNVRHPELPTAKKTGGAYDDEKLGLDDWLSRQYGDPGE